MKSGDWLFGVVLLLALLLRWRSRHLRVELLLGLAFGVLWEGLFSDFWTYDADRFGMFAARDIPVAILAGWPALFLSGMAVAERLGRIAGKYTAGRLGDWSQIVWDTVAFTAVGVMLETLGIQLHLWHYEPGLAWNVLPGLAISAFAAFAYASIGIFIPTAVRHWREHLSSP
jgi:hypothetical protein